MDRTSIRNFCIIAHIDHGKSTLADRLLEMTGAIAGRDMVEQVLDKLDLERERGITIKLKPVRLSHVRDGEHYVLNLIDTPGHVDFSYEVSRSLAACEGAVLVVDATQGIQAQTLANLYMAIDHDLTIIPVVNKVDLPSADPDKVAGELVTLMGIKAEEIIQLSAKTGYGVDRLLDALIDRIPPPQGCEEAPLRALIFDSHFDSYRGVIPYVRVVDGSIRKGTSVKIMGSGREFEVSELGVFMPEMKTADSLMPGEVGFISGQVRNVADARVGDTVTYRDCPAAHPLPGYQKANPMVFCGMYPADPGAYGDLRESLEKLKLNDASLTFEPESSVALGFGFRCGFLGLLHMEVIQERLEREYDLNLITTAPSVVYTVTKRNGEVVMVDNPAALPAEGTIESIAEPIVEVSIISPTDYIGAVMELATERRGTVKSMDFLGSTRVHLTYRMPLSEILYDFFDKMKYRTRGYASLDYEYVGSTPSDLVKLDVLVGGKAVDALSSIVHSASALDRGRALVERLRKIIPRHLFDVPIQAAVGSRVIARETVKAMRKDVLAKCYGGDITRKRKLLEKQKEGKKRMRQVGQVEIPQEAFMAVLKPSDEED